MSHIYRLSVTDDLFRYEKDIEAIAEMLINGDRVMIDPIGEVFLYNNDGTPQVEFVFENNFITGVLEKQIERLRDCQEKLKNG